MGDEQTTIDGATQHPPRLPPGGPSGGGCHPATSQVQQMATFFTVSCIFNGLAIIASFFFVVLLAIGTCGIGCLLLFLPLIHVVGMVLDILAIQKLRGLPTPEAYSFVKVVAVCDIVCLAGLVTTAMGILNLVTLGKPEVYDYFHRQG